MRQREDPRTFEGLCETVRPSRALVRRPAEPLAPILRGAGLALFLSFLVAATPPPESTVVAPGPDTADIASSVTLPGPGQQTVLPGSAHPFRPGESLRFSVQYGFIHAGSAWLEVPGVREYRGHRVYELLARAESNTFFSRFYKVRERIESSWAARGHYSLRYFEDRREGKFRQRTDVVFDPDRHEARYSDGAVFPVPPGVQDALSSFYYTRTRDLPIGGSIVFHYHASRKSQPLQVKVLGRERIQTPAGTFDCVAVEPILRAGGIFRSTGRLVIWLTADERRIPVLLKSKVMIGSVSVVLQEVKAGS